MVTGGTRGIGRGVSEALLKAGAKVVATYQSNGKAAKEQVAFMVKRLLGIKKEIKPLDITDAIAVAITHSQRLKMK